MDLDQQLAHQQQQLAEYHLQQQAYEQAQQQAFEQQQAHDNSQHSQSQPTPETPQQQQLPSELDERLTLWRAVANLGVAFQSASTDSLSQNHALAAILERLTERQPSGGAPKHRDPRQFNGRADQVDPFLQDVTTAVFLQRRSLATDREKVIYLSLYLADGAPSVWYQNIKTNKPHLLDDFDQFVATFRARFEDSDIYASSLRKIRKLKQTGPCATFTNQFIELLTDLDWSEQTKIQEYYDRLKPNVKLTLANRKGRHFTRDFEEYTKICIEIDNELHNLSLDTPPTSSTSKRPFANPSTFPTAAPNPPPASNDVVPMEIDAIRRGPLSAEEKERRRKEGLCMYCGQGKHFARDCPNKKAKAGKA
ncbi:hypothetical protein MD484_g5942, partial [Candolleomyces efflorescens]